MNIGISLGGIIRNILLVILLTSRIRIPASQPASGARGA